jgi:hypothetical protein
MILSYFVLNHCHSSFTALSDATTCDCVTSGKDVSEEVIDFFCAHMTHLKAPGAVVDQVIRAATVVTSVQHG